jgi:hypothetical protein
LTVLVVGEGNRLTDIAQYRDLLVLQHRSTRFLPAFGKVARPEEVPWRVARS